MSFEQGKEKPPRIGMKLSALTEDVLREVFLVYDRVAGGKIQQSIFGLGAPPLSDWLGAIKEGLEKHGHVEFRFGSRLKGDEQMNAKFYVWNKGRTPEREVIIQFSFDQNIVETAEGKNMRDNFEAAMNKFFSEQNLAVKF